MTVKVTTLARESTQLLAQRAAQALRSGPGLDDPYPNYAQLRDVAPVYRDASLGMYLITRYDDCRRVLTTAEVRVPDHSWHDRVLPGWREHPAAEWCFTSLPFRDRLDHARLRSLVNRCFTRRRVAGLRASMQRIVDRLLDAVSERGADGRAIDLQQEIGFRLPVEVIANLVGVPYGDLPHFRWLFGDILRIMDLPVDDAILSRADEAMLQVHDYFTDLLRRRPIDDRDDLVSALLAAGADDQSRVSENELISLIILLFTGGFETTTLTIGTGTHALLVHPWARDLLRADPSLVAGAVEEILRWDPVVQRVVRMTDKDLELGDVLVPAGSVVGLLLGAANRDPAMFSAPDRFDIRRRAARPLTFGGGPYGCLGYALAKAELELYFAELTKRFPDLELADTPRRRHGSFLRGLDSVPVSLGSRIRLAAR